MASSAPPSDATKGPVLSLIDERLGALRNKRKRILEMEESIAQEKPSILASIDELEKLRPQLSSALQEELSLAAQRLPRDDDAPAAPKKGEANNDAAANDGTAGGGSSAPTSTEDQGMATSSGYDYEVFLSFAGSDTRPGFTDFLYTSLDDAGIRTFKDDKELRKGEEFAPELLQAIEQSKISIPIFSKGYASSVWCLKELAKMVKCQKTREQKIIPIFYDVAPSEVRHQIRGYAKAFLLHEKKGRYGEETICQWKAALYTVGAINGWDLHDKTDRREGEFAKAFTEKVFSELKKAELVVSDCFVRVDNHVDAIMEMIGDETRETRIIGIYGMGGIGKTTIAKTIYNQLSNKFKHCCFLSNIREMSERKGIPCLQRQLISDILKTKCKDIETIDDGIKVIQERLPTKKVLLLLDDVGHKKHMDALVGKRTWFGTGSKLIITTRNKEVLEGSEVDKSHAVSCMNEAQSLQLFSKHAFKRDSPLDGYINQSKRAISIAGGLPLALKVIGSLLLNIRKEKWDGKLDELENIPPEDVQSKLKISYNALRFREKHIFLDIACLFIGYDKDIVVHFWDKSKFFPDKAMEVLQSMSLISIEKDNKVWMHDLLRDLGREIVLEESNLKIEKQSRVWDAEEGVNLLRRHKGYKEVEALRLRLDHWRPYRITYECFENLSKLRFLEVDNWIENLRLEESLARHGWLSNVPPTNENSYLLPQLRWLSWHCIPPTFNITNFSMEDVVILDLSDSDITHDWQGWSHMKVMKNLKVMDLSWCNCLERTPNFSAHSNLERLSLNGCTELVKIDESICQLKSLVSLDVRNCSSLRRLPDNLGRDLASLEYLSLNFCSCLDELPHTIGNLESLIELHISETRIEQLPDSIGNLKNLKVVRMRGNPTKKIPDALWTIEKLEEIDALDMGEDLNEVAGMYEVDAGKVIEQTDEVDAEYRVDEMDDRDITAGSDVEIGNGISRNRSLRILALEKVEINALPRLLPESLIILVLSALRMHTFPNLSNLTNLKRLKLIFVPRDGEPVEEYEMPRWIGELSKLESLRLASPQVTALPTEISLLPRLRHLHLNAPNLRDLPSLPSSLLHLALISDHLPTLSTDCTSLLPRLQSLYLSCPKLGCLPSLPSGLLSLHLDGCRSGRSTGDISNLKELSTLKIRNCAISEIRGLDGLQNLVGLSLWGLPLVEIDFDLSNSNKLQRIVVADCSDPVEIRGKLPPTLSSLDLRSCGSLRKLPDVSHLKELSTLVIRDCAISEIRGLDGLQNLVGLSLWGLPLVEIDFDLSNSNKLQRIVVADCSDLVEIRGKLPPTLSSLDLRSCGSLRKLPDVSHLKELSTLVIRDCAISEIRGLDGLQNLGQLYLGGLPLVEIDFDLSNSNKLQRIVVTRCSDLVEIRGKLPPTLSSLDLQFCGSLRKLPDVSHLKELSTLVIRDCAISEIRGLDGLQNLGQLYLGGLPLVEIDFDLSNSNKLQRIVVTGCSDLVEIRGKLPPTLSSLDLQFCGSLRKLPDVSHLKELSTLEIRDCAISEIRGLDGLQNLGELRLVGLPLVEIDFDLSNSNKLQRIVVTRCSDLVEIRGKLPPTLSSLDLRSCGSLRKLPDVSHLKELSTLNIYCCAISKIRGLDGLQNLGELYLGRLPLVEIDFDLSNSNKLQRIVVTRCSDLVEIRGKLPPTLSSLDLQSCGSLRKLPDVSHLKRDVVHIEDCGKLDVDEIQHGSEREDDESESKIEYGSEDEDDESECETDG